jgi:hypothetical protein
MRPNADRKGPVRPAPDIAPPSRKRFQIERLEERIAPAKGGKTNGTKWTCSCQYFETHNCSSIY